MRFGLALPHYDFSMPGRGPVTFEHVADAARDAERLGFDSVWISDHFFLSLARYGGDDEPQGSLEPMTALGALATVTERVRLGTLVVCAPFRHPGVLAKQAAAVDLLSGGRLDLGIGAGWYGEEFEAFAVPYGEVGERFGLLEETLQVVELLFQEGPSDFEGGYFTLRGAYNHPRPVQTPRPPVWLGAKGGERSLRLAARYADGWNTVWRWAPEAYADRARAARAACERVGRDPSTLRLSVGLSTLVGEDERDLRRSHQDLVRDTPAAVPPLAELERDGLAGTPDRIRERIAAFEDLGVEELIASFSSLPFVIHDRSAVELFAESVLAPARAT
jgi:F420-dependent oxidoreductase-like protein